MKALPLLAALILSQLLNQAAAAAAPRSAPAPKPVAVPRSAPMALPIVQTVRDAADVAYPGGTIMLDIDATDVARGTFRVTETIPLATGTRELTLLLPRWLPGTHAPRGSPSELVAMTFSVGGKPVDWRRDPVETNSYHLTLPVGAHEVVAKFIFASPLQTSEGRVVMTQEMLNLQWEAMSLYPAGH